MKGKLVSVSYNDKGECIALFDVKNLDQKEYAKHLNDYHKQEDADARHKKEHLEFAEHFEEHNKKLTLHDICLAKSLYDNYVDRGYFDEDDDFQKDFADFLFRGSELHLEKAPSEFTKILERLGK